MTPTELKPGWLKRDLDDARREVPTWPASIRPFLDGSYRPAPTAQGEK